MFAKYKFNINQITNNSGSSINIPITMDILPVDQSETIQRDFVDYEVRAAINPIEDYEKVRFLPVYTGGTTDIIMDVVTYKISLITSTIADGDTLANLGFVKDDIKFNRNKFKRSFLRLLFYDSDSLTNQNLLFFETIYLRRRSDYFTPTSIQNLDTIPASFKVENPIAKPNGFAEGYHLYFFKDLVSELPYELYMRAEYNSAVDGVTTNMMTTQTPLPIDEYVDKLFVRYVLRRSNNGYYYVIDEDYSDNVTYNVSDKEIMINLYQVNVT